MAIREDVAIQQITLSERAASEVKGLLAEQGKPGAALRVWVSGGGCSGLQYGMAIDEADAEETDVTIIDQEIKIFVDPLSLKYMTGAVVDFVDDHLGGGFKIENPNATKSCGCGSSFAPGEEDISGLENGGGCGGCGSK